jgi:CheY-like chemotaxis protein/HPt (histidine-containing phosphotransfer) domain-containing protein
MGNSRVKWNRCISDEARAPIAIIRLSCDRHDRSRGGCSASLSSKPTRHTTFFERIRDRFSTRILIVEDNVVNQKVAVRQVGKLGYRADVAANGLEALEAVANIPYDIVLMDCQMPVMDGYQATAVIREREGSNRRTIIIAMTANALEGDRERCIAAGMDDYISKPVKMEELQKTLTRWQPAASEEKEASDVAPGEPEPVLVSPPVDVERLLDVAGGDEELLQELVELYLDQTSDSIEQLSAAVATGDASSVKRLAHSCVGGSATCGMNAIVTPLRELESMADGEFNVSEATRLCSQVSKEFERIKLFLAESEILRVNV